MSDSTISPDSKRCTKCNEAKPLQMFHRHKSRSDGYASQCKECRRPLSAIEADKFRLSIPDGMKWCGRCDEIKPIEAFYRNNHTKDGLQTRCALCSVAAMREWQKANPEKCRAKSLEWARAHPEQTVSRNRKWRERNPDYSRINSREWRQANLERARAREKAYAASHPEQRRAMMREWQRNNRDKVRATNNAWGKANPVKRLARKHARRTRLAGNGGSFTQRELAHVAYIQDGKCCYCGRLGQKLSIDHVIPVIQGGPSDIWNIALCCPTCNSSKGDRTLEQWVDRWYLRQK